MPSWVVTVVSSAPAMTWALVTIRPGRTAQPEPSIPSPQAVLSTRTTEPAAWRTSGSSAIAGFGGCGGVAGPEIDGAGSTRSSAFSTGPVGGRTWLRLRRITESWTSARSCVVPGACRATAPKTQARPSATAAISAAPPPPSARCRKRRRISRSRRPSAKLSTVTAASAPISSAPSAPQSGA